MSVTVTLSATLPDWWGADEAFADGGEAAIKEMIEEDLFAFAEDAVWVIKQSSTDK